MNDRDGVGARNGGEQGEDTTSGHPDEPVESGSAGQGGESISDRLVSAVLSSYEDGEIDRSTAQRRLVEGIDELIEDTQGASGDATQQGEARVGPERFPGLAEVMAHEIRNPVGVLLRDFERIGGDLDTETGERILRNVERIEAIVDDVMTLSRQADASPDGTDLDVTHVANLAWESVETGEAALETERTVVEADDAQLRQLLENLFRNTIEHGSADPPGGTAEVGTDTRIRVGPVEDGFYVADDGRGIPEPDREQIFDRGFSTKSEGTGFGLAIVAVIAENHGWEITVTDSDAGGARFEFTPGGGTDQASP